MTVQPKYNDDQSVMWNGERVTIHRWWRTMWPNGGSGVERIGYDIKEYPATWAWEEELSQVKEGDK